MTDPQRRAFESELADPELSDALLRESTLLCRVATGVVTGGGSVSRLATTIDTPTPDDWRVHRWGVHSETIRSLTPIRTVRSSLAAALFILVGYAVYS